MHEGLPAQLKLAFKYKPIDPMNYEPVFNFIDHMSLQLAVKITEFIKKLIS
jgi:hypothetical protein